MRKGNLKCGLRKKSFMSFFNGQKFPGASFLDILGFFGFFQVDFWKVGILKSLKLSKQDKNHETIMLMKIVVIFLIKYPTTKIKERSTSHV